MKLKGSTIAAAMFCLLLLNDTHIFYISHQNHFLQLYIVGAMLLFTVLICNKVLKSATHEMPYFHTVVFSTVISFLFVYVFSLFSYPEQSLMRTLIGDSGHYKMLLILLVYPLVYICWERGGTRVLFRILNTFAAILYITMTIQFFSYGINGKIYFPAYFANGRVPLYNGTLKIHLNWLTNIMILYNFYMYHIFY